MPRLERRSARGRPYVITPLRASDSTFSSGVDITGVSVDPASAADFLPNTTSPHMGLQLLSPTDILVDVTGDAPATNDKLILDVTTSVTPTIPEPSTWAIMCSASRGLGSRAIGGSSDMPRRRAPADAAWRARAGRAGSERR